ncbi:MAG: hypothetical protein HOV82_32335 [Streptomyces sp.]|nr:hypothetical protein [Streptomyces sp.]NUS16186.1 hypothetical protein [Streptomyces sp.]NUS26756.1 hypothetical protein [Streptomyces sp.]
MKPSDFSPLSAGYVADAVLKVGLPAGVINVLMWDGGASRVELLAALLDTARQEPELCSLVRQRYIDSLHQAVEGVRAHAEVRGDLPRRGTDPAADHSTAVSAALALLLQWHFVRGREIGDGDIATTVDVVLMPLV